MSEPKAIREAEFDPKVKQYWVWQPVFVLTIMIVTIPVAVVFYVISRFFVDRILRNMSCTLTERTLEIKKGIFNKTESTIPLEKITDLQLFQGPIMRFFGLHGFKVETAGQSSGAGGSLVHMIGIVDTKDFRKAVLAQRDRLNDRVHDRESGPAQRLSEDDIKAPTTPEQTELLREIRDTLGRVEAHLNRSDVG